MVVYHGSFESEAPSSSNCILHVNYVPNIWYVKAAEDILLVPRNLLCKGASYLWEHREPGGKLTHCKVLSAAL